MARRNYEELRAQLAPEIRAAAQEQALTMMAAMAWEDLAKAQNLSREDWEKILRLKLAAGTATVAELRAIAARLGGRLEFHLQLPEGNMRLS